MINNDSLIRMLLVAVIMFGIGFNFGYYRCAVDTKNDAVAAGCGLFKCDPRTGVSKFYWVGTNMVERK